MAPSAVSTRPVLSMNEIVQPSSSVSRKRPSSSTSSNGSSSSAKRHCSSSPDDSLSCFLSSKRTAPSVYSGKAKDSKTRSAPLQAVPSQTHQTEDYFHHLVRTRFPKAVFKHSSTSWKQHFDALVEKQNADKLEKLVNRSKAKTIKKIVPVLHPTMALLDQLRAQRLQEAQSAKENGPEEVKPKKKAVRRQRNWN